MTMSGLRTTSAPSIPIVLLEILNFVFIELPVLQGILREHDLERMNVIFKCKNKETKLLIHSLSRTLVLSSPVLVELRPWRGGAERCDTLLNIRSHAFNSFHTDIGGDDFTSHTRWRQRYFQDGCRPVIFDTIYESGILSALRSLDIDWHLCLAECITSLSSPPGPELN